MGGNPPNPIPPKRMGPQNMELRKRPYAPGQTANGILGLSGNNRLQNSGQVRTTFPNLPKWRREFLGGNPQARTFLKREIL